MKYAFVNTKLVQRSARLPINRLRALSESNSKAEILDALSGFGIQNIDLSLQDASLKLSSTFRLEAERLANLTRMSKFLRLFLRRFEILEAMDFITNFNELKISKKLITKPQLSAWDQTPDLKSFVNALNRRFGFNLNQNSAVGELRDRLFEQYFLKLSTESEGETKSLVEREKLLMELPHRQDFIHFLNDNKGSWFYKVLRGDTNILDLKATFYLYERARRLSVKNPLGEMVPIGYLYNMDLNYKFMKILYFSVKKGIKLDFEEVWEI